MPRYLKGLYMSLGMFSIIPQPFRLWDEKAANLVLPCFPIVGGLIGVLWWGIAQLLSISGLHIMLVSAVLALTPFIASGFLHLDGYMDTSDAVLSRRPIEEKLHILKDPHTGAFAIIMLAVLFLVQFASVYALIEKGKYLSLLIIIPVVSRCCTALSVLCLKTMPQSAYANMFRQNAKAVHKVFIIVVLLLCFILSYCFAGVFGLIVTVSTVVGFTGALVYAYRNLKGISGDVAGFALVIGELCGLVAMAVI